MRPAAHGFPQVHDRHALATSGSRTRPRRPSSGSASSVGCVGHAAPATTVLPRCGCGMIGAARSGRRRGLRGRWRARGLRLAPAGQAEAMNLADHRVARHAADLGCDLARAQALGPELLQKLDPLVRPGHARICHVHLPPSGPPSTLRIPEASRTEDCPTALPGSLLRAKPPHEMSYSTAAEVTRCADSGARVRGHTWSFSPRNSPALIARCVMRWLQFS